MKYLLLSFFMLMSSISHASITNTVKSISIIGGEGIETVQIKMIDDIRESPRNFYMSSSYKMVIDFDATSTLPKFVDFSGKVISSANIIVSEDRTRVILNLRKKAISGVRIISNRMFISFSDDKVEVESTKTPKELITEIRSIVDADKNLENAIELINSLLLMSQNEYTEEAQELIGRIYSTLGQYEKAKAEDKVFLALYPNSQNFTRVRQRLISLEISAPTPKVDKALAKTPKLGQDRNVEGNVSEYVYYSGTSTNGQPTETDQITATTNVRVAGTYRNDQHNTKISIRGGQVKDILTGETRTVVSQAYVNYEDTFKDYKVQIGRQNPQIGIIGRFDGVSGVIDLNDTTYLKLALGKPYIAGSQSNRQSYSAAIQKVYQSGWMATYYGNYQIADGFQERLAIGVESSYFKDGKGLMINSEYDVLYRMINSFTVQGNMPYQRFSPYFLLDFRKSPVLFGERGLMIGYNTPSKTAFNDVGDMLKNSGLSKSEIYKFIDESTPYNNTLVLGSGYQLNGTWNINVNGQVTNMSATSDTSFAPVLEGEQSIIATAASGNIYSLNIQIFGNDVRKKGNSINGVLSFSKEPDGTSSTLTLLDGEAFDGFRIDNQLSLTTRNKNSRKTSSVNYSIKVNYKLTASSIIEAQYGLSKTFDEINSLNQSFFIGFKYDF